MNNRIGYIDFLRGIAIIFVVLGHIIQDNMYGRAAMNNINFIYSYHMGFFFFISGCAAVLSTQKYSWETFLPFVKKKAIQLLLPFFVWGGGNFCLPKWRRNFRYSISNNVYT